MFVKILMASFFVIFAGTAFSQAVISVEDNFFAPANITIGKGTTVTWTWNGNRDHTVTSGTASAPTNLFDSGVQNSGSFSFKFNSTGKFPYFCRVHGAMMSGTITVTCPNQSQLLKNPGFESGGVNWNPVPTSVINNSTTFPARTGTRKAQLNGKGTTNTASIVQQITIPSNACTASLSFYLRVATTETTTINKNDTLKVQVLNSSGALLKTLKTFSNLNKNSSYVKRSLNILSFKGKTIRIRFLGTENSSLKTTFLIDDTALRVSQ